MLLIALHHFSRLFVKAEELKTSPRGSEFSSVPFVESKKGSKFFWAPELLVIFSFVSVLKARAESLWDPLNLK